MAIAAVPKYLQGQFRSCPPGHRFTLYGQFWKAGGGRWERVKDIDPREHLNALTKEYPNEVARLRDSLIARQDSWVQASSHVARYVARSASPFVTGTGIEHPLENGMAFTLPYGLPYLPGSSVKGVLRRAAEELQEASVESDSEWTSGVIAKLFGPTCVDSAQRGLLTFWDVVPDCNQLGVEIMNPHYGKYYRGEETPHDAGNPIPIYFLVIPEGTKFVFHVQCDLPRARDAGLENKWRALLSRAFDHAFEWLGFGAKTAVGYGALRKCDAVVTASSHQHAVE